MARTVLITGCRSGFGLLTAKAAAEAGWIVYAGLRDRSTADELLRVTAGLDVRPLQLDITSARDRDAAVRQITEDEGGLDGLVNNAGRALGGFLELVEEDELRSWTAMTFKQVWLQRISCTLMRGVAKCIRYQARRDFVTAGVETDDL